MMPKLKLTVARTPEALADALALSAADAKELVGQLESAIVIAKGEIKALEDHHTYKDAGRLKELSAVEISSIDRLVVSSAGIPSRRISNSASRTSYSQFGIDA